MAVTIVYGPPRVGKTARMTALALEDMRTRTGYRECKKRVEQMQKVDWDKLTVPESGHMVFADYTIFANRRGTRRSNEVDGYYLGLPNADHPTMFLPPYSQIYLDEAQKYYNSRESKNFSDFVSRFYEFHGHNFYNITMSCQRPSLIDINIRELASFIEIIDLKIIKKHGRIERLQWLCHEFENWFVLDKHQKSGKADGDYKKVVYTFEGNIFNHYDSYGNKGAFFKDKYDEDFSVIPSEWVGLSLDEIKLWNLKHDFTVPDTYYKKDKKSKKERTPSE